MRQFHFYHAETGLLHQSCVSINTPEAEKVAALNCPEGHLPIEGELDPREHRIDVETKSVVDYQPPAPSADHEWNRNAKRWQLSAAAQGKINRSNAARARIAQLEASQHRHVREHCLGMAGAAERLKAVDDEIFSLRSQLQ
jgi:hypothetical protein